MLSPPACRASESSLGLVSYLHVFGDERGAIVLQSPRCHLLRLSGLHAHDYVAVPRPSMFAIVFAWPRRMIRMRVVPANQVETVSPGGFLCIARVFGSHEKA